MPAPRFTQEPIQCDADDHENHANGVEVESVLIRVGRDGEIEDSPDSENHEAGD